MRWAGHVARVRERRVVHRVLVEKPEGKRTLERLTPRLGDNIKMDLHEVDVGTRTVSICFSIVTDGGHLFSGNGTSCSIKCREFLD